LARNNIGNQVVVVRDGQDAIDWLEATGPYASRDVLRRLRASPRTAIVPVVILTSSNEERDRASGTSAARTRTCKSPSTSAHSSTRCASWECIG
jgi:CheY-like chemotaxis protein